MYIIVAFKLYFAHMAKKSRGILTCSIHSSCNKMAFQVENRLCNG